MRSIRFLVGIMFIITALAPLVSVHTSIDNTEEEIQTNPFGEPVLKDLKDYIMQARGQPCPTLALQNDAGQPGDAGNSTTGPRAIGNNPTTTFSGCVDGTDGEDWYEFDVGADYNVDVELSNFDFDYDLLLGIENKSNPGQYFLVDDSQTYDPIEKVSTLGSFNESEEGKYVIVIYPWDPASGDQGDYQIDIWTNYTESCIDWFNPQNDANTGQDAPQNWTDSPTNMGNNVTASYTGCLDGSDGGDVFAFDVPLNHTITASLSMESGVDFELYLHQPNGSEIDESTNSLGVDEFVTSADTTSENQPGTYFVNISHFSGSGNYTFDVWTNYSVPIPNLAIDDITFNQAANPGDVVPFDITVINDGTLDLADPFMAEVILSVDSENTWVDHNLGNATWSSGLAINATQVVTVNGAIPTNLVEGEYNVFVILDSDEMVAEKSETDNTETAADTLTVGNGVNACATPQDDAASGNDIGEEVGTSFDLGLDVDVEVRGCIDSNDEADLYKVSISPNQPLEVTLVTAPIDGADFDLQLLLPNGTAIDTSWRSTNIDEIVTLEGTDYENTGGDYYVNVTYWGGFTNGNPGGTYRLLVGEPDQSAYVPPFSCGTQNDLGLGQDASSSGIPLGTNNPISGTGCLSNSDTEDVYSFTIDDYKNVEIHFNTTMDLPFTATLTNSAGDLIASVDNMSYGLLFESINNETYEGQSNSFTLTVDSNGGQGSYDIDLMVIEPALPDLIPGNLVCPTTETFTDEEITVQWLINNAKGPGYGQTMVVLIELINSDNETVNTIYSSETASENPGVTNAMSYNQSNVQSSYAFFTVPTETTSGDYRCKLIIDSNNEITESDESNNIHFSEPFYIQNEEELYANDVDRDGFNSTDNGDGKVDGCPSNPGTSTVDRYGCPDLDSDGVSNDNDILPNDPTQWYDTDGDGFGDNPIGTNGDQCPDIPGVFNGDDGAGCPILDLDSDGVLNENDLCPDTPIGTIVGADGCEIIEEPVDNNTDTGDNTTITDPTDPTDPTEPGDNTGSTDGSTDTSDDTESESGLFGMSYTVIGIIGVVIVLLLATLMFVRGRGSKSDAYSMQEKAYADAGYAAVAGIGAVDASITPEQLAYEQQLIAAGYPADYARAYADQHFRPWLKQ
ncbi:MAG TPA: hypothetical protein HA359_01290 [Candidatus Poseidoniaceae archaeon]|nr:MAG TPA: hypothetical protein D7H84_01290 [Candidatus Poseidoniales archaeon]HII22872.1 hypothetical protein [Candidatus Poseidoniaceae archaeon]